MVDRRILGRVVVLACALAAVRPPRAQVETVVYCDDFEYGPADWIPIDTDARRRPEGVFWHLDEGTWFCATEDPCFECPGPGYGNHWSQALTKTYALPAGSAELAWDGQCHGETGFDFCHVDVLPQGETEFVTLASFSGGMQAVKLVDLDAYGGTTVVLRFRFTSDGSGSDEDGQFCSEGAWRVSRVQVTGHPEELFVTDGQGWSASATSLAPPLTEFRLEADPPCTPAPYLGDETELACEHSSPCGASGPGSAAWAAFDPMTGLVPELPAENERPVVVGIESPVIPIPPPMGTSEYRLVLDLFEDQSFAATRVVWQYDYAFTVPGDACAAADFVREFHYNSLAVVGWAEHDIEFTRDVPDGATGILLRLSLADWQSLASSPGAGGRGRGPYFDNVRIVHVTAPPGPPFVECVPYARLSGVVPQITLPSAYLARVLDDTTPLEDLVVEQDPPPGSVFACAAPLTIGVTDQDGLSSSPCTVVLLKSAATLYYRDLDGDGYGDPDVASATCDGTAPAGYVVDGTDCDDTSASIHPGAAEACNGLDDDCDGAPDDAIPAPAGRPVLAVEWIGAEAVLSWTAVDGATGYDVVRGELLALRSTGGDFTIGTTDCLADDATDRLAPDGALPAPGEGIWYLVRAVSVCGGNGSYDDPSPGQQGSRDNGIAAAGGACP